VTLTFPDEIDILVQAVYEEKVDVPESLLDRLEKALEKSEGEAIAQRGQANQAIIGRPDDASWNDPARYVLYDEDEPGVHRTLMAQTRLTEDSVVAIPLWPEDGFFAKVVPDFSHAKMMFMRAMSLSRKGVVKRLRELNVPEGWVKSPLLRNCFPMIMNRDGHWVEDDTVRLDEELGLVYESKETQ
jgi:CRISPR-associated endonuclease/helicase Cas3